MPEPTKSFGPIQRVSSGAPWESKAGYCRATRRGPFIAVAGTCAIGDDQKPFAPGDAYRQTARALEIALKALAGFGAQASDVMRTRMFVTDISRFEEYARAHAEVFHASPPALSLIGISRLVDPAFMVEIEIDAVLDK